MFAWLQSIVMTLLSVPGEPHDPSGAPGTLKVFQPAVAYFNYRVAVWALGQLLAIYLCAVASGAVFAAGLGLLAHFAPGEHPYAHGAGALQSVVTPHAWKVLVTLVAAFAITVITLQAAFTFVVMRLDFALRWYKVTDRSLRIREGVWNVRELTMSFANIQNISVTQGPIQRYFGVSDLVVESAGGGAVKPGAESSHAGYFRGVANAEEIKSMMLARLRALKESGGDAHDAPHPAAGTGPLSGDVLGPLREVRDEARALRSAVTLRRAANTTEA